MSNSNSSFGERLAKVLAIRKINQAQASELTGVPKATISHIIRSQSDSYKNSIELADGLKINHDWLTKGIGGIYSPNPHYIPVIKEYFRLRLYHSEMFLEDETQFIITERNYGDGVFATCLDNHLLICSSLTDNFQVSDRSLGYLLWTERRRSVITDLPQIQGKRVFIVHEMRNYETNIEDLYFSSSPYSED
ncbi:helix-turn-helix domain-containing protein [Morganella psychrotolerans]|uniref:helix-turn-helix domain-containing protein n=1 Tax=Morganella psychrotolerans TaxID=368603 RepID=UPI0039AF3D0B